MIPWKNPVNWYIDAIPKLTFIFPLLPCIIPGNDTYTFKGQLNNSLSESDTSCLGVYISDKQDSKALLGLDTLTH